MSDYKFENLKSEILDYLKLGSGIKHDELIQLAVSFGMEGEVPYKGNFDVSLHFDGDMDLLDLDDVQETIKSIIENNCTDITVLDVTIND